MVSEVPFPNQTTSPKFRSLVQKSVSVVQEAQRTTSQLTVAIGLLPIRSSRSLNLFFFTQAHCLASRDQTIRAQYNYCIVRVLLRTIEPRTNRSHIAGGICLN